jgi:hypothetical protein
VVLAGQSSATGLPLTFNCTEIDMITPCLAYLIV